MNSHGICSALLQPLELLLGQQQQQQQQRKLSQQEKRRVKGSEFQNLALVCACADGTLLFDRCNWGEGGQAGFGGAFCGFVWGSVVWMRMMIVMVMVLGMGMVTVKLMHLQLGYQFWSCSPKEKRLKSVRLCCNCSSCCGEVRMPHDCGTPINNHMCHSCCKCSRLHVPM